MILAVAELKQPVFGHTPVATGRGAIQAHPLWLQVIHAQQLLGPDAPSNACQCPSSLKASSTPASRSSLTSRGWSGCPVQLRRVWSRCSAQGSTWFSRWFASDKIWVNQTTVTQPRLRPTQLPWVGKCSSSRGCTPMRRAGPPARECHRRVRWQWSGSRPWCTSFASETLPQFLKPLKI